MVGLSMDLSVVYPLCSCDILRGVFVDIFDCWDVLGRGSRGKWCEAKEWSAHKEVQVDLMSLRL